MGKANVVAPTRERVDDPVNVHARALGDQPARSMVRAGRRIPWVQSKDKGRGNSNAATTGVDLGLEVDKDHGVRSRTE